MMVINGRARQACASLIDKLPQPIRIAPARTFPVIRDLLIDRSVMFESLKRIQGWINVDGSWENREAPIQNPYTAATAYEISHCMTCGLLLKLALTLDLNPTSSDLLQQFKLTSSTYIHMVNLTKKNVLMLLWKKACITSCGNSELRRSLP